MIAAAKQVSDFSELVGVPLTVALIGLVGTLAAAAVSVALGRWGDTTARRRAGYAEATRELVSWSEYPFRIRRRTSDDPLELTRLADLGHLHQEALRYRETWIASEDRWMAQIFSEVRTDLAVILGAACNDAWSTGPVKTAAGMTLGGWGPAGVEAQLERFQKAVVFRFGWRRIPAQLGVRAGSPARPGGGPQALAGSGLST